MLLDKLSLLPWPQKIIHSSGLGAWAVFVYVWLHAHTIMYIGYTYNVFRKLAYGLLIILINKRNFMLQFVFFLQSPKKIRPK